MDNRVADMVRSHRKMPGRDHDIDKYTTAEIEDQIRELNEYEQEIFEEWLLPETLNTLEVDMIAFFNLLFKAECKGII